MRQLLPGWLLVGMVLDPGSGALAGKLVDDVVAVVNRHVITRSEVHQEAILVLVERRGGKGLALEVTPEFMRRVIELLINQRVLLDEARRLGLPPVTEEEREQLLEGFKRRFSDDEVYTRFLLDRDLTDEEIAEILSRHLKVERLKETKLRVMPEVTEVAVRQYYDKNRHQLGGAPLELVSEAIRLKLLTQGREKVLASWVWELRKRSEVKVLVDLTKQTEAGD